MFGRSYVQTIKNSIICTLKTGDIFEHERLRGDIVLDIEPCVQAYNYFLQSALECGFIQQEDVNAPRVYITMEIIDPFTESERVWKFLRIDGYGTELHTMDFEKTAQKEMREFIFSLCEDSNSLIASLIRYCLA